MNILYSIFMTPSAVTVINELGGEIFIENTIDKAIVSWCSIINDFMLICLRCIVA